MKFEIENRKGELKMENENQKPKLSLDDIFNIRDEVCDSREDDCTACPFDKFCSSLTDVFDYKDKIEIICAEWEKKRPTLAEKINEILKPYDMRLGAGNYICFMDEDTVAYTKDELVNKLYTTRWKGHANE
jgi:hypothetical protein